MARPAHVSIDSGIQNWDGKMDDNFNITLSAPIPIHEHVGDETDLEATFAAAFHDRCHVMVNHTVHGWSLYVSDGTNWVQTFNLTQPAVVALTDNTAGTANDTLQALTDPADTPATADLLRDDLVANLIPELRNNYADLAGKINEIRTALVDHGLMS